MSKAEAKKGEATKEVAKTAEAPPPAKVDVYAGIPEHMRKDIGKGLENLSQGDYEMPRLKLLQGISPELLEKDGLKAGWFYHTLTEDRVGENNGLRVVPIYIDKRYVLWRPRHDGGGILARADDGVHWNPGVGEFEVFVDKAKTKKVKWVLAPTVAASRLGQWGTYDPDDPKSPPAATQCYVVVVMSPDNPELGPMALMLQRSTIRVARKLMGKLQVSRAPSFGTVFTMDSVLDQNANGDKFYNFRFTMDGFVQDAEEYNMYAKLHEQFKKSGVQVKDLEGADEAGEVPQDEGGGTDTKGKF